jgi:hypothetical protein
MYKRPVLLVVALCAIGFLAGFYLGQAPLRRSLALSGGAPGDIATQLQASAASLNWPDGRPRSPEEVVRQQVRLSDIKSVLAARLYCQMSPAYRTAAQLAASQLLANASVSKDGSKQGREARLFMQKTSTPGQADCSRFRPD